LDMVDFLDRLAELLCYPDENTLPTAGSLTGMMAVVSPTGQRHLEAFVDSVRGMDLSDLEELYTRTFDLNPVTCLDVGWHIYGERYERGSFLVRMREYLQRFAIGESHELPDHLTHVLMAVARMEKGEAEQFVTTYVLPAMEKMLKSLEDKDNPYKELMQAVYEAVQICSVMTS